MFPNEHISIFLILTGAVFLAASLANNLKIFTIVPKELYGKWVTLSGLICFFLLGYIGYVTILITDITFPLELLVGGVFLGGAFFVFLVINLAKYTIQAMHAFSANLEQTVTHRTQELAAANRELEQKRSKLEEASLGIKKLMRDSYLGIRAHYENKNLIPCWERRECGKSHCTAFHSDNLRCWQIPLTHCNNAKGSDGLVWDKMDHCESCEVYRHATQDPLSSIGEQFNTLMSILNSREEELKEGQRKLAQADHAKSQFLANMSHELRTPMHAILSFSEMGMEKVGEASHEKILRYFSRINTSGHRLLSLLNDLLDLSKLEAGRMALDFKNNDLAAVVNDAVEELQPLLENKSLELETVRSDIHDCSAMFDYERILQVIRNLLSNAIKFSPEKSKISLIFAKGTLPVEPCSTDEEYASISCTVIDEGCGVPDSELEAIFDKFIQSSKTKSADGGTGLGLAICKEIIQAHRGEIQMNNTPTGGAMIRFQIPVKQHHETSGPPELLKDPTLS